MPLQIYHCFVCLHKSIIVLTHILQMIPNRKKKQTNKKLKHRQPVRIILHVSTQSITTLCLNRFARPHIIRQSLTHFVCQSLKVKLLKLITRSSVLITQLTFCYLVCLFFRLSQPIKTSPHPIKGQKRHTRLEVQILLHCNAHF